jgi:outer membrane receptor protein involved in Fe transport
MWTLAILSSIPFVVPGVVLAEDAATPAPQQPPAGPDQKAPANPDAAKATANPAGGKKAGAAGGRPQEIEEITVTATRTERDPFEVPRAISLFQREAIQDVGSFVAFKAATRTDPSIWYDERNATSTDPIIRGFAGFDLLALVDGNTLSTLWGEGGPGAGDVYGKVDSETVDRIEVIRGPGSALYGSNALGAVLNVVTRRPPIDYPDKGWTWGGRTKAEYDTVDRASGARLELFGAEPGFRFMLGGSARNFNDIRGGGDDGLQVPSGGRERNWDLAAETLLDEARSLRFTVQDVERTHIDRYNHPTDLQQKSRQALAAFYDDTTKTALSDRLEARLYYQDKHDDREYSAPVRRGYSEVVTYAGGLQSTKDLGSGHVLTAGLSAELDAGDSPDDEQLTFTYPGPKRRDAPLSDWFDAGLYAQDEWRLAEAWSLLGSVRRDEMDFRTRVDGAYVPAVGNPRDDQMHDRIGSTTGGLGVTCRATKEVNLVIDWARGFRQNAPSFGVRPLAEGVQVPNSLLPPTTSDNFEIGAKVRSRAIECEAFVYRSLIRHFQGGFQPATFNGSPYLDLNGNGSEDPGEQYIKRVAGGGAYVQGLELTATVHPHEVVDSVPANWSLHGGFAKNRGRSRAADGAPADWIENTQPMRGILAVRWEDVGNPKRHLFVEAMANMVSRYDAIPGPLKGDSAYLRDPQDSTSGPLRSYGGTPGYTVFSIYSGVNFGEKVTLRAGIDNIFDKKYRPAHNRMDGAGLGATVSLEVWF